MVERGTRGGKKNHKRGKEGEQGKEEYQGYPGGGWSWIEGAKERKVGKRSREEQKKSNRAKRPE